MGRLAAISTERRRGAKMHTYSDFGVYLHQGSPCDRGCNGLVCGRFFPGLRKNLKSRTFRSFCPLFERADCTAVKTAKAKEEDRTKIDPLEKSYVSTETGQVQRQSSGSTCTVRRLTCAGSAMGWRRWRRR